LQFAVAYDACALGASNSPAGSRPYSQLDADIGRSLRLLLGGLEGALLQDKPADAKLFDGLADLPLPAWCPPELFAVYERTFAGRGFYGALNWYRNFERNWQRTEHLAALRVEQPTLFLLGERDPVGRFEAPTLARMAAKVPRCIVDLNRGADEIDPLVVRGVPRHPLNQRTLAGLGVIPRVVSQGRTIHDRPIDRAEAERRIAACWRPYHAMLAGLIAEARTTFGQAILIDMHSMPHDALSHLQGPRPDMVLGNRHGLSASARVSDIVAAAFEAEGWRIRRNSPFSGAYICSAYGRPGRNVHVVQIEIDRALYMDEKSLTPLPDFDRFAERLGRVIRKLAVIDDADGTGARIAAE
jgi:N-formylglutamate amidohydrolase